MSKIILLRQLTRFGIVGFTAAVLHLSLMFFLVETYGWQPLIANVIAFFTAFQVSYWGHRYWTFDSTLTLHRVAFPRLLFLNAIGLIANEGLFYFFITTFHLPYLFALFLVLAILPLATFTLNKFWVFR